MSLVQPRTPPGVMELLPKEQRAFQQMMDTVRTTFERFGFQPVETPVFELTNVLLTKSGGETEKQVYFAQSTGSLKQGDTPELALRFDLTVPLARYVAEHEHELVFPFRRYQQQRVYRGERAQKGRYREFYQWDIDIVGKDTLPLGFDAEVPAVIWAAFQALGLGAFTIRLNNRKLLRGVLETVGVAADKHEAVLHEVDRLGKLDRAQVEGRLCGEAVGITADGAKRLLDLLTGAEDSDTCFAKLGAFETTSAAFAEGKAELEQVYAGVLAHGVPKDVLRVDLSIARGLDYYTGTVYETFLTGHEGLGSICSGGRYDNLAGHYTKSKLPGVGISIGATRLFSQLLELGLVKAGRSVTDVLVANFDEGLRAEYGAMAAELRKAGVNVEVFASAEKLGKQFKYAERLGVPVVVLVGDAEVSSGTVKVKDAVKKEEKAVPRGELVAAVKAMLAG